MKNKKIPLIIGIILLLVIACTILYFTLNKKITITFIDDTTNLETLKIKKGTKIKLPTISKEGYIFEGWYYNNNKITENDTFDDNITIVAKWIEADANTMTFTFDTNGGNPLSPMTVECEKEFHLPTPTKDGYKFLDWRDKNEIVISDETKLVCQNIELKANWEEKNLSNTSSQKNNY